MNAADILGGLLRAGMKGKGGGIGAEIVKDILASTLGGKPTASRPAPSPTTPKSAPSNFPFPGRSSTSSLNNGTVASDSTAKELEDMLGVGTSPSRTPTSQPSPSRNIPTPTKPFSPTPTSSPSPTGDIFGQDPEPQTEPNLQDDEKAALLIRAMIYAGKADGRIDNEEQQRILDQVGNASPETIRFLRDEFTKATDVREFAWSVPVGMEQAVYSISLATINMDSPKEVQYMKDLATGLRLSPQTCNQIHNKFGLPLLSASE